MQQPSFESSSLFHINIRILLFSEQTMPRYKISDYPAMETAGLVLFLVACVVTCLFVCLFAGLPETKWVRTSNRHVHVPKPILGLYLVTNAPAVSMLTYCCHVRLTEKTCQLLYAWQNGRQYCAMVKDKAVLPTTIVSYIEVTTATLGPAVR